MKWNIPSKTFLLGEYAALHEASALILTTTPCFTLSLSEDKGIETIHPQSPAGLWWQKEPSPAYRLTWHDPYQGQGGLGASSAQFLGTYLARRYLHNDPTNMDEMLEAYYQVAWSGKGLRPSGYDVMAQSQHGCVYINKQNDTIHSYPWPFEDLSFFLVHTGIKLATHHHLQDIVLPKHVGLLSAIVEKARKAFTGIESKLLIDAVNEYHYELTQLELVAPHTLALIEQFKAAPEVLAIKGCGALGADVLLIITSKTASSRLRAKLIQENHLILATEQELTLLSQPPLIG